MSPKKKFSIFQYLVATSISDLDKFFTEPFLLQLTSLIESSDNTSRDSW